MRPIKSEHNGNPVTLVCVHWKVFPPKFAEATNVEELRAKKKLDEPGYQRLRTWNSICGLMAMEEGKCHKCPHARVAGMQKGLPVLVTLDGKIAAPTIDIPTLENSSRHRDFLVQMIKPRGK